MDIAAFLHLSATRKVLDVRTPAEYKQGHLPGAINFPLFSNEERAEIGTLYKQVSQEVAFHRGLQLVGPRMSDMVSEAARIVPEKDVLVHCWRGGQRSGSVGWLLESAGFKVTLLEGGYKAYRRFVLNTFEALPQKFLILGGPTGSGKTELLRKMEEMGAQVLDLEKLANHKGSAFGSLGEEDQPSCEHFENELEQALRALDPLRPIWLEHESRGIGRVFLPDAFWRHLQDCELILVDPGREARLRHVLEIYGSYEADMLKSCFTRIATRLDGQHVKAACEAIDGGDIPKAASIALDYYDKAYSHHLEKYPHSTVRRLSIEGLSREAAAGLLMEMEKSLQI